MFFYGRIIIPLHSLSSKSRNSKVFTHSDFKMALSFAIIGSIAATTLEKGKFVTNVYRKKTFSGVYTNFDSFIPETYKTG